MNYGFSCFISGLNDEIQTAVRMFNPQTLHDAYYLAKLQEPTLASIARKIKPTLERPPYSLRTTRQYCKVSPFPSLGLLDQGHLRKLAMGQVLSRVLPQ